MILPEKATKPTMYFIGVTTGSSSIMKLFPLWAERLGLKNAVLKGLDLKIHDEPENYRRAVEFIKNDPLSLGALVTTHKIDIYEAAKDLFDELDPYAKKFGELSSISKSRSRLEGHAKDFISCGLAMDAFIPEGHWGKGGEAFIMGAGGSALAISAYLCDPRHGNDMPSKITIANRSMPRLEEAKKKLASFESVTKFEYMLTSGHGDNDVVLEKLPPYSLVVNATGLGKDRPGSPLTSEAEFPENAIVWELNYRGDLLFIHQALKQKEEKDLIVEDGWIYFIHGWTQVISQVFHVDITGKILDDCESIAKKIK